MAKKNERKKTANESKKADEIADVEVFRYTEKLSCRLTKDERQQAALNHVESIEVVEAHEAETKEISARRKGALRELELVEEVKRAIVKTGEETRDVDCEERRNYRTGIKYFVRLDTGAVLKQEALSPEERQRKLPGVDGPSDVRDRGSLLDEDEVIGEDSPAVDDPQSLLDEANNLTDDDDSDAA